MTTDSRLWAKVDLGYLTNPKMSEALDASTTAPLMHLASILHCAQHLTDGEASARAMMRTVGGNAQDIELLLNAGLWHEPEHECEECPQPQEGKIYVHNYLNHNVSSEKVNKKSKQASEAARERWRKEKEEKRNADRMQDALPNAMLDRSDRSDQIITYASDDAPKKAATSKKKKDPNAHNTDTDFKEFWKHYPLKKDKKRAYDLFLKALEIADLDTLVQGAINYTNDPTRNFTKHASTWLDGNNWEDSPNVTAVPPPQQTSPNDPRNWNQPAPWL